MSSTIIIDRNANTADRARRALQQLSQNAVVKTTGKYIIIDSNTLLAIKSADGHYWGLTVNNAGALITTDLGTTLP